MSTSVLRSSATATSAWALGVLPACFLLSGLAGIVYQIGWARQFALVFGTTEVAVALVLASYMTGLGLGARDRLSVLASATDPRSQMGYEVNAVRLTADGDSDAAQDMIQQGLARYPQSEDLRYEYIQPWLTRLARGTATKEVTAQAAKLTHSADAVVRGTLLASQHRWDELRTLDDSLNEATWRDPWKLDAVLLQVQWRCREGPAAGEGRQRGEEALSLIDAAISAQPALALYAARVQSALAARRGNAIVESIWEYGSGLFADASLNGAEVRPVLEQLLGVLGRQTSADQVRREEVRRKLQNDINGLAR